MTERSPGRRQEDIRKAEERQRNVEEQGAWDSLVRFAQHYKAVTVGAAAIIAGLSGAGGFLGAQAGMPQRMSGLEVTVAKEVARLDSRIDEAIAGSTVLKAALDSLRAESSESFETLLRIGCPTIQRADLARACRPYAAPYTPRR